MCLDLLKKGKRIKCFMKYLPFSFQPSQRTYSATDFIHFLKHIIRLLTGLRGCKRAGEEEKKKENKVVQIL